MGITARRMVVAGASWLLMGAPGAARAQDSAAVSALALVRPRALAALLADASLRNALPPGLIAYKTNVETEIAVLIRRENGAEVVAAVEDAASTLRWTRAGVVDQRVTGYRAQRVGFSFSMLSVMRSGWLNPTLYGNRLRIRARASTPATRAASAMRQDGNDTLPAVHPLATDRDRYYTFTGGDTVVTMRSGDRSIPIVQVRVQPRADVKERVLLFDGELDLDASRGALVRLRGRFVRLNSAPQGIVVRALTGLAEGVAFIEYENGERDGQYWLPAKQRIELQVTSPMSGEGRAVVRIVSRFTGMQVNDTVLSAETLASADSNRARGARRFSMAPRDSMDSFNRWEHPLGALVEGMHADDFDDIGPDRWKRTGPPRFSVGVTRGAELVHFNRVEGPYTGLGASLALRDVAPGVLVRALGGYAWSEGTVRGELMVQRTSGEWRTSVRAGRTLDITNDFRVPLDSGPGIFSLLSTTDAYDYVDRRAATFSITREVTRARSLLRADVGVVRDGYRPATLTRAPLWNRPDYRANRGVDNGGYLRSALLFDWHPSMSADFVRPGAAARFSYERGDGTLDYERAEVRVMRRGIKGPFTASVRGDAGMVWSKAGSIPPQQLFELGSQQGLPGYEDKEFVGNRASIARGQLRYTSPWLQRPVRIGRRLLFPGISPGASVGVQAGWTELSNQDARLSLLRMGVRTDSLGVQHPVATVTDGWRATVTAGLRFFSGSLFVGAARPVETNGKWKAVIGFGEQW